MQEKEDFSSDNGVGEIGFGTFNPPMSPIGSPEFVTTIKEFRKEIDALIQKADRLWKPDELAYHRQMGLVKTKLEEAKMWAGKVLEAVGNPFPAELADKANVQ